VRLAAAGKLGLDHASIWLYHPEADFFSQDMGVEGTLDYLAQHRPDLSSRLVLP